jgi:acyl carrier protein
VEIQLNEKPVAPRTPEEKTLANIWTEVLEIKQVGIHDSFFELGGHSLLAVRIIAKLSEIFKIEIPLRELFAAPTIAGMIQTIDRIRCSGTTEIFDPDVEAILEYNIQPTESLPITNNSIFLTGSTGFLGGFLLYDLLTQTTANIHCLVRSTDKNILVNKLKDCMLWNESFKSRIVLVYGDLSKPLLGLGITNFEQLASTIDVIYHNGAWVNHIYPYSILKATNVLGTQEILRLASQHHIKPVHFVSTIGTINLNDTGSGYIRSKVVAEKMIKNARKRGLPVCIYRPYRITDIVKPVYLINLMFLI